MNENGRNEAAPPNRSQFHALIREEAISTGRAIPQTDEEFALAEKCFAQRNESKHDFAQIKRLIESGEIPPSSIVEMPRADESFVEELAQAARNGAEIPQEIKERMEADRIDAEREHRSK